MVLTGLSAVDLCSTQLKSKKRRSLSMAVHSNLTFRGSIDTVTGSNLKPTSGISFVLFCALK